MNILRNDWKQVGDLIHITINRRSEPNVIATIDAADASKLKGIRRIVYQNGTAGKCYAIATYEDGHKVLLHRIIADTPEDMKCVFSDGNGFNCRRENLHNVEEVRILSRKGKPMEHKYIFWETSQNRWCAQIKNAGTVRYIGRFRALEDAIAARDKHIAEFGA